MGKIMDEGQIKEMVRARYGGIAEAASAAESCCAPAASCCGPTADPNSKSRNMGYSDAELAAVPEGANLGLVPLHRGFDELPVAGAEGR